MSADFYSYNRESGKRNSGLLSTLFGYIDINAGFLLETWESDITNSGYLYSITLCKIGIGLETCFFFFWPGKTNLLTCGACSNLTLFAKNYAAEKFFGANWFFIW